MMCQSSLARFEKYTKKTRKGQFLEEMERIVPWSGLTQGLNPYYPDPSGPSLGIQNTTPSSQRVNGKPVG